MKRLQLLGVVFLVLGVLALVYGGFSYTKEEADAKLGPIEIQLEEKEHVRVPVWAGVALVAAGGVLLVLRR